MGCYGDQCKNFFSRHWKLPRLNSNNMKGRTCCPCYSVVFATKTPGEIHHAEQHQIPEIPDR